MLARRIETARLADNLDTQYIAHYVAQLIRQTVMPFTFDQVVPKVRRSIIAIRLMKSFSKRSYDTSELLVCVQPDLLLESFTR